jgi:NADPH:quinone reductase-like Zn-dependent oxidoreductase
MKSVQFNQFGNPEEVLKIVETNIPEVQDDEVQVKMFLRPINPYELYIVRGVYPSFKPSLPSSAGFEGVGIVEKVGEKITNLKPGQRVIALGVYGTWQEYIKGNAAQFVPVPDGVPDESAALIGNPMISYIVLKEVFNVQPNEWLLDTAATSNVGGILIQYANALGFNLISVVRNDDRVEDLRRAGAKHIINTDKEDLSESVNTLTSGEGVSYVVDTLGGEMGSKAISTLKAGGHALSFGKISYDNLTLDPAFLIGKQITLQGFSGLNWFLSARIEKRVSILTAVFELLKDKKIIPPVADIYTLENISKAVNHAVQSNTKGKVLLR